MKKLLAAVLVAMIGLIAVTPSGAQQTTRAHVVWVAEVLKLMQTIKPGMTRKTLLTVFATEGGLSTGLRRTFVSRDCPYFKVDVEFQAVGPGNAHIVGNSRALIVEDRPERTRDSDHFLLSPQHSPDVLICGWSLVTKSFRFPGVVPDAFHLSAQRPFGDLLSSRCPAQQPACAVGART